MILGRDKVEGQLRVHDDARRVDAGEGGIDRHVASRPARATGRRLEWRSPAMDPRTGEILAMVGSHDFSRDDISGQVNNVTALNQPGSTKPIAYVSAFAKGWNPSTIDFRDEPLRIQDGESTYVLNNADLRYRGDVTARTALGEPLNVPAVKTLDYAGLPNVYSLAEASRSHDARGHQRLRPRFHPRRRRRPSWT